MGSEKISLTQEKRFSEHESLDGAHSAPYEISPLSLGERRVRGVRGFGAHAGPLLLAGALAILTLFAFLPVMLLRLFAR